MSATENIPRFQFKPPVSLSGTPLGRPWKKRKLTTQLSELLAVCQTTQGLFDDRCRFAVELAGNLCCPMWSFYYGDNPPPKNASRRKSGKPNNNNKQRFGDGFFWLENAHHFDRFDSSCLFVYKKSHADELCFLGVSIHHVVGCNWSNIVL